MGPMKNSTIESFLLQFCDIVSTERATCLCSLIVLASQTVRGFQSVHGYLCQGQMKSVGKCIPLHFTVVHKIFPHTQSHKGGGYFIHYMFITK